MSTQAFIDKTLLPAVEGALDDNSVNGYAIASDHISDVKNNNNELNASNVELLSVGNTDLFRTGGRFDARNVEFFIDTLYHDFMFHPPVGLLQAFETAGLTPERAREAAREIAEKFADQPDILKALWELKAQQLGTKPVARERFADRPKGEDAIAFYARVWVPDLKSGKASREDIIMNDPDVIDGVLNRCNYLRRGTSKPPSAFYPEQFPPPSRSAEDVPERVKRKRESGKRRAAKHRNKVQTLLSF